MKLLKKFYFTVLALVVSVFLTFPASSLAITGPIEPTGPQGQTGADSTGPTIMPGPIEPTGPQAVLTNETTGPNSTNANDTESNKSVNVSETNSAVIDNNADISMSSGSNLIDSNSSVGTLKTGDIQNTITTINVANSDFDSNSSIAAKTFSESGSQINLNPLTNRQLLNNQTGPNSNNINQLDGNNLLVIKDANSSDVNNEVDVLATTGENIINNNTDIRNIETGSIEIAVNTLNLQNISMPGTTVFIDLFTILNDSDADLIIPSQFLNNTTGPNSSNSNSVDSNSDTIVTLDNQAVVDNNISLSSETGSNEIANNSTVGDIETGKSNITNNITNVANAGIPILYVINIFGEWLSNDQVLPENVIVNEITGPGSSNSNQIGHDSNSDIQIQNTSTTTNNININAVTGKNKLTGNTTIGNLKTGSVDIYNNIVNVANSFAQGFDQIYIAFVNIFGNWGGKIKSTDDQGAKINPETKPTAQQNSAGNPLKTNDSATPQENDQPNHDANFFINQPIENQKVTSKDRSRYIIESDYEDEEKNWINNELENTESEQKEKKDKSAPWSMIVPAVVLALWGLIEGYDKLRSGR